MIKWCTQNPHWGIWNPLKSYLHLDERYKKTRSVDTTQDAEDEEKRHHHACCASMLGIHFPDTNTQTTVFTTQNIQKTFGGTYLEHLVTTVFTETDTLTTVIRGTDALTTVFTDRHTNNSV